MGRDIDLVAAPVTAHVTLGGASIAVSTDEVAALLLLGASGDRAALGYLTESENPISALILPGTYDVYLSSLAPSGAVFPTNGFGKLQSGLVVGSAPLTLSVDIAFAPVAASLTLNGKVVENSDRQSYPSLELRTADGDRASIPANSAQEPVRVLAGTYDAYYTDLSQQSSEFPTNTSAKVRSGVVIGSSPVSLAIDIPATTVTVNPTLAGAALQGALVHSSFFTLRSASGDQAALDVTSENGSSSAPVLPGTYDLYYRPPNADPGTPQNPSTPIKSGIVVGAAPLSIDVDIPVSRISGKVTVNGAVASGIKLTLRDGAGGSIPLSPDHAGAYAQTVLPGRYQLIYDAPATDVAGVPTNGRATLAAGIDVGRDPLALDVEVPVTQVSGQVTVNGQSPTRAIAKPEEEGYIGLSSNRRGQARLSAVHAGSFSTSVLPGTYDLWYESGSAVVDLPSNGHEVLKKGVVVGSSPLTLDVDVPAVSVSGTVTVNGAVNVDKQSAGFGALVLDLERPRQLAGTTSSSTDPDVIARGGYSTLLVPGVYELWYRAYSGGPRVPANRSADVGCFDAR